MKDISKKLIAKFANQVGVSIYKRRTEGNFYDPVTGTNAAKFVDTPVLIAFDTYTDKAFPGIDHRAGQMVAYISGQDLDFEPKKNDIIQSFDDTNFIIIEVKKDMYSYAYSLLIKIINDDE